MTNAAGPSAKAALPLASRNCAAIAMPKAIVLPDPVRAETIRSRPSAAGSMTCVWTGVAVS